jgi:hypothetical protein
MDDATKVFGQKLDDGSLSEDEMNGAGQVKDESDREKALSEAIKAATDTKKAEEAMCGRFSAGTYFSNDIPPAGADMLLPVGYAVAPSGVYHAEKQDDGSYVTKQLTRTAYFVAARDVSSGKVLLMRRVGDTWYRDWLRAGQIKPSILADLLILPADTEAKELVAFALTCAADAPLIQVPGAVSEVAKLILDELLPENATFPYLMAVPVVRQKCQDLEVEYKEVRKCWERLGIIEPGEGRVRRVKADEAAKVGVQPGTQRFLLIQYRPPREEDDVA